MTFEIVLYFDDTTDAKIVDWMEKMCGGGINRHVLEGSVKPFLRLALFEKENAEGLEAAFREYAGTIRPWIITFSSIGFYPPAELFLVPSAAEEISEANMLIHLLLSKIVKQFDRGHLPNLWTPRVSLGMGENTEEIQEAFGILMREFEETGGSVVETALLCTDTCEELLRLPF